MIRVLNYKEYSGEIDFHISDNQMFSSLNDFLDYIEHYFVTNITVTKQDSTIGVLDLEDIDNYMNKCHVWFEELNEIKPKRLMNSIGKF